MPTKSWPSPNRASIGTTRRSATLRVRQVRPAVRPGVQRRRDGERGVRHVPGRQRLPLEGDRRRVRAARRDHPPRACAHVVRRPGHDALVGRPVAQRVVRDIRLGAVPGRRRRAGRRRGPRSPTSKRPGPTDRISCRQRIRSPPIFPTCTRSRSTSMASRTPRGPASSSSWRRTSGSTHSCARCASTSACMSSGIPPWPTCCERSSRNPDATCRVVRAVARVGRHQ